MSSWDVIEDRMSVDAARTPDETARRRAQVMVASARVRGVIGSDAEMLEALDMLGLLDAGESR